MESNSSKPTSLLAACRQATARGDLVTARVALEAARAAEGDSMELLALETDIRHAENRAPAAEALPQTAAAGHSDDPLPAFLLARLARQNGDLAAARRHLDVALALDPEGDQVAALPVFDAELLNAEGAVHAAVGRLEALHRSRAPDVRSLLLLAAGYRSLGRVDDERACLMELVAGHPSEPKLLRAVFEGFAKEANRAQVDAVLGWLRARGQGALADELGAAMFVRTARFHDALDAIRRERRSQRGQMEAFWLAQALWGTHRYELCLRYTRFCLRRWPRHAGLSAFYLRRIMQLARLRQAGHMLHEKAGELPDKLILHQRLMLYGYRGDFTGALRCFEHMRKKGLDTGESRSTFVKLMYNLADISQAEAIYARVGHPKSWDGRLLHRQGLPGMFALEFDLEHREMTAAGPDEGLSEWVRRRPASPMAAIRLVDAWREEAEPAAAAAGQSEAAPVPRRIFQYWDDPDVPTEIEAMIATWRDVPGFTHRLFDRAAARRFLRDAFGRTWVKAFQLASDAAMEADLLRLCLLAKFGGVYSDADDVLYGDLDLLLRPGRGLILYREIQGGALANNFIAAPPRHPAIVHAAKRARNALLQRSVELAWTKTGPGLLTCAVAQYLLHAGPQEARRQITVLEWPRYARDIVAHNPAGYKSKAVYWENTDTRGRGTSLWQTLVAGLDGLPNGRGAA